MEREKILQEEQAHEISGLGDCEIACAECVIASRKSFQSCFKPLSNDL